MNKLLSIIFCLGVSLLPVGALYQPKVLGYLGASPGILLITSTLFFLPLYKINQKDFGLKRLFFWGFLVSIIGFIIYGYSELYIKKTFSLVVLTLVWMTPLIWYKQINLNHLRLSLIFLLSLSVIGVISSDFYQINLIQNLVFSSEYLIPNGERIRGFSQETAHFSHMIGSVLILLYLIFNAKKNINRAEFVSFILLFAILMVVIGSRGSAIGSLIALLIATVTRKNWIYLLPLAPIIYLLGVVTSDSILIDVENFTSTATRVTLSIASINALLNNPLGYGYYGFYGAIQEFGRVAIEQTTNNTSFITTELVDIVEELNNVSSKSALLDFSLVYGFPFIFFLWSILKKIDLSDLRPRVALTFFLLTSLSNSGHQSLFLFIGLTVLLRLYPRNSEISEISKV